MGKRVIMKAETILLIHFYYYLLHSFQLVDWAKSKFRASSPAMFNYSQVTSDTAKLVTLGSDQEL